MKHLKDLAATVRAAFADRRYIREVLARHEQVQKEAEKARRRAQNVLKRFGR